jgi:hypothetical protein
MATKWALGCLLIKQQDHYNWRIYSSRQTGPSYFTGDGKEQMLTDIAGDGWELVDVLYGPGDVQEFWFKIPEGDLH